MEKHGILGLPFLQKRRIGCAKSFANGQENKVMNVTKKLIEKPPRFVAGVFIGYIWFGAGPQKV